MALKIKSAVIGCGRMGAFTSESMDRFAPRCWFPLSHAQAIRIHPDLELIALCDTNPTSLDHAAGVYGISRTYSDYRNLIEEVRPELIGIATRTVGRVGIIRCAADIGVRALHIEKPLCNSVRELATLAETFAHPDLFCTYGAIRRFFMVYQAARELATSGVYGALREIRVNMGPGMLFWTHPHSVDLILYIAGERRVEMVQARLSNVVLGKSVADIASDPLVESASIYFDDGVAGYITRGSGYALVLSCADGEITVENDGQGISISAPRADNPYYFKTPYQGVFGTPDAEGTLAPLSHLVCCLSGSAREKELNGKLKAQILQGQEVLFAMVQSHIEQSKLVRVHEVDPSLTVFAKTGEKFA
jgi:scyllo-inositol 2-dehydrogenase (NAD+)